MNERFRYRVAINNNFKKCYAYLDFKKFGVVTDFVAFCGNSSGLNEGESLNEIGIYLNYKLIALSKTKNDAIEVLEKLVNECPNEAKKDYENYKELLFRSLR